jgi:AcrR family transcriptional regulator
MSTLSEPQAAGRQLSPRQFERRRKILTAAQRMLARHGYDGVSMRMIAEEAGVAERTLFNIHAGKAALIAASARERSDDIIGEAWDIAPDPGTGFLMTMCATLTRYTLEDPDMARSYAPVLIQHADLIGLHEVYRDYVGRSLRFLAESGGLPARIPQVLPLLFSMNIVATIEHWASGTIASEHLELHMQLAVAHILLPHAEGELSDWARKLARECVAAMD